MSKVLKKTVAVLLCVVMLLGIAPLNGFVGLEFPTINLSKLKLPDFGNIFSINANAATTFTSGDYSYTLDGNNNATLTQYTGSKIGHVTLPQAIDGYTVTVIGYGLFSGATTLTSVTLPSTLKEIENTAFSGCTGLTSITLPESLETIYGGAFTGCSNIQSINYPKNIKTSPQLYKNFPKITSVVVPEGVTVIPYGMFGEATTLTSITLPSTLKEIENTAFSGCTGLRNLTFLNSKLKVDSSFAFNNCPNMVFNCGKDTDVAWYAISNSIPYSFLSNFEKKTAITFKARNVALTLFQIIPKLTNPLRLRWIIRLKKVMW